MKIFDKLRSISKPQSEILFSLDLEPELRGNQTLKGWAFCTTSSLELSIEIEGEEGLNFFPLFARPDVHKKFSDLPQSLLSGFEFELPVALLEEVGPQKIKLIARANGQTKEIWSWNKTPGSQNESYILAQIQSFLLSSEKIAPIAKHLQTASDEPCTLTAIISAKEANESLDKLIKQVKEKTSELPRSVRGVKIILSCQNDECLKVAKESYGNDTQLEVVLESTLPKTEGQQELVLNLNDNCDITGVDIYKLIENYIELTNVSVLMPFVYGGSKSVSLPPNIKLSTLNSSTSLNGKDIPALYSSTEIGPVSLSNGAFLKQIDSSTSEPRTNTFHFDLRQAVIDNKHQEPLFSLAQRNAIEQVIKEEICFKESSFTNKAVAVVIPENASDDKINAAENLARIIESSGPEVIFVEDSSNKGSKIISGRTTCNLDNLDQGLKNNIISWAIATNSSSLRTANLLRYQTNCKVAYFIDEDESSIIQQTRPELLELTRASLKGHFVPICTSEELSNLVNSKNEWIEDTIQVNLNNHPSNLIEDLEALSTTIDKSWAEKNSNRKPLSIIIPVFNALDATTVCLRSLLECELSQAEIIIVNDCSDTGTSEWLRAFAAENKSTKLVEHQKNTGFIGACISGLHAANPDNDILLVNSDVVVSKQAIKNIREAAYSNPRVGVASCLSTNSPHLQIEINPGESLAQAANWLDENIKPEYPTVITPEGQFLYIRNWAIEQLGFFDTAYDRGFCEESDMCLRMFLHGGIDTVACENALIFHRRSASFGDEAREKHLHRNRPVFDARWGMHYINAYKIFSRRNPIEKTRSAYQARACKFDGSPTAFSLKPEEKDFNVPKHSKSISVLGKTETVFILPNAILGGGSLSVFQHVNEMILQGHRARVISLGPVEIGSYPLLAPVIAVNFEELFQLDWSNQNVIATFWTTSYAVSKLCDKFNSLKGFYYVQDYEPWFYSRPEEFHRVEEAEKSYELGLRCVAKTNFLKDLVEEKHNIPVEVITPGIDLYSFYPGEQDTYVGPPRMAALFRPRTARRGNKELLELLRAIRPRLPELRVSLFGERAGIPDDLIDFVDLKGKLTPQQVAELYRNSDVVVDLSFWQGFGRMGIEGMSSGAVPLLSDSGGVRRYAIEGENSVIVDSESVQEAANQAIELFCNREKRLKLRQNALETSLKFSESQATKDWIELLRNSDASGQKLQSQALARA